MRSQGTTQMELAAKVGVSQAAVSNWLNGTIPKGDQLWALATILDVSMEWLLTGEGTKRSTFAIIKDGFILVRASFMWTAPETRPNEEELQPSEESQIRFEFLPQGDPWSVSAEQQQAFCARYFEANDEQKREMLGIEGKAERTIGVRMLGSIGVQMKRHLSGITPKVRL